MFLPVALLLPPHATVFRPQPNVDSALVAFRRRPEQSATPWREIKRVVEGSFAYRRKRLPNSLELAGVASREQAAAALRSIGRSEASRAEELEPADFVGFTDALAAS